MLGFSNCSINLLGNAQEFCELSYALSLEVASKTARSCLYIDSKKTHRKERLRSTPFPIHPIIKLQDISNYNAKIFHLQTRCACLRWVIPKGHYY